MKNLKVLVGTDSGEMLSCDAIEHENGVWLVPQWLESPAEGYKVPARIIRANPSQLQKSVFPGVDFLLNETIPKSVLDGKTTADYEVIDAPDIRVHIPSGVH